MENLINTLISDISLNNNIQEIILEVNRPDLSNLSIITREVTHNNRIINNLRENRIISFQQILENIQHLNNFSLENEYYSINSNIIDNSINTNINTNINNFINSTINDKNKYKKVITDNEFEKLETILYNENTNTSNKCCPIYYLDFENNDKIIQLPCKHIFFSEAIEKWLKEESNLCPVCRYSFDYKEIITNQNENQNENQNQNQNQNENENQNENLYFYNNINEFTENFFINLNNSSYDEFRLQEILLESYSTNLNNNNNNNQNETETENETENETETETEN